MRSWFCPNGLPAATLIAATSLGVLAPGQTPAEPVRYGRDIRPLLADRCFRCHGPDAASREAGLRLDLRDHAIAKRADGAKGTQRDAAIVPGDAGGSLLYQRIIASDPDDRMPPAHAGKPYFTPPEVARIAEWITAGATYEAHWAFEPPVRPAVPANNHGWVKNPIDSFLAEALGRRGLAPSPDADAETLARRVFLVLTGLPPTPAELDAFLADARPDAYDQLVDRLLTAEPYRTRHAEHLAQPWLDAARYADTCGIHMDAGRQIWPWRDWLIAALHDDKPFDQFVVEQLAGDLLPAATQAQRTATGFLRAHVTTDEGGAINEEYLVEYAAERTATVGTVFFGLTVGCARCHDHKFDPITQVDYYRLFAFFNNNEEPGLYSQSPNANRALEPFLDVPTSMQSEQQARLAADLLAAEHQLNAEDPDEASERSAFFTELQASSGLEWPAVTPTSAVSKNGSTLTTLPDGSVLASGENPPRDVHMLTLRTDAEGLRLLCLEALTDPSLPHGKVGRAPNGNAVLEVLRLETRAFGSDAPWTAVPLVWAMADVEQQNGDHSVVNALAADSRGWAVAGHEFAPGPRRALFLAGEPFGGPGGTELRVTLEYDSIYAQHALGRVRLHVGKIAPAMLDRLPVATSGFYHAGPFASDRSALYAKSDGPDQTRRIDLAERWGKTAWRYDPDLRTAQVNNLSEGINAHYVAHEVYAPTARKQTISLGSDDGYQIFVAGQRVRERQVDRGAAADQDQVEVEFPAGTHAVVLKVCNTGGAAGFYWQSLPRDGELAGDMRFWLLPPAALDSALQTRIDVAWRERFSPGFQKRREHVAATKKAIDELTAAMPRTMVMSERAMQRDTFLLTRGEYDKPDRSQPMTPAVPKVFGQLAQDQPQNRLGLARWLVSPDNPLLDRVAVNRLFEFVFGTGIVRTSEDFGYQGEWPSHPELLDWLTCEFQSRGHSMRAMLRLLVTSHAFRQQARVAAAAHEIDPDNRLLAWYPRRRLTAEGIRDQALFVAGLLVEKLGGPSVKPYQPPGLWQEVAMLQSNTRNFQRDDGEALWRRSLYTYWKRACPPPTMMMLDAPTREFCTVRRSVTNTPLQALALWNDEQFVEAARLLAQRTLHEPGDDRARLRSMYRRCTGHDLDGDRLRQATDTLAGLRHRYLGAPADARSLLAVGETPRTDAVAATEHAAWLLIANAFLNLDATLWID